LDVWEREDGDGEGDEEGDKEGDGEGDGEEEGEYEGCFSEKKVMRGCTGEISQVSKRVDLIWLAMRSLRVYKGLGPKGGVLGEEKEGEESGEEDEEALDDMNVDGR